MRIGTRGSALALWQARTVARLILESGGPECEIVVIRTSGDEGAGPPDSPAVTSNIKRAFVKESRTRCSTAASISPSTAQGSSGRAARRTSIAAARRA